MGQIGGGLVRDAIWNNCCIRADNGMDGSVLFRQVIKVAEGEINPNAPLYGYVLGVLVYREDARRDPTVNSDEGDVYAAMSGKVGRWVNEQIGRPWPE
jgi:hypothetical protein